MTLDTITYTRNWCAMKIYATIEFLGLWEQINNSDFKPVEFDGFKIQAGNIVFALSPQNKRVLMLNEIARIQMQSISSAPAVKKLETLGRS